MPAGLFLLCCWCRRIFLRPYNSHPHSNDLKPSISTRIFITTHPADHDMSAGCVFYNYNIPHLHMTVPAMIPTKINIPRPRMDVVMRPRIFHILDEGWDTGMIYFRVLFRILSPRFNRWNLRWGGPQQRLSQAVMDKLRKVKRSLLAC